MAETWLPGPLSALGAHSTPDGAPSLLTAERWAPQRTCQRLTRTAKFSSTFSLLTWKLPTANEGSKETPSLHT